MKIETQEQVRYLYDYHSDGYLIWKNCEDRTVIGKKVYSCKPKDGRYLTILRNKKRYRLHRIIFLWHHGYLPAQIDHADGNKLNNRIENLREATDSQNRANSSVIKGSSKYKGVYLYKRRLKKECWRMKFACKPYGIRKDKLFNNEEEAALEYNKLAVRYHKEFAVLNIIKPT